jgi:uncharacterized membrane protein
VHALFYSGFFEDPITWFVLGVASSFLVARRPVEAARPALARTATPVAAR